MGACKYYADKDICFTLMKAEAEALLDLLMDHTNDVVYGHLYDDLKKRLEALDEAADT